jgi:hypothetical protein
MTRPLSITKGRESGQNPKYVERTDIRWKKMGWEGKEEGD